MTYAVETCHLSKTIDDSPILNDITMGVKQGEIYGFFGENALSHHHPGCRNDYPIGGAH